MLKALELFGFKSFADKTRLEFPPGISVVVGPNGSGKSNIVDAVKWVLGSQSAKSLRGKEMIDVIFNGCASRGPSGTGEVTLTLDNSDGRLGIDSKEVHVSRRVYRSGEGEYLINREPCRLRDIRELLAGTGITTEAYCIIEQGKVDALLQSSPRDRRVIFEEAAGISQFKIKKATAARRMERVEQNLLRLSDIVDEVEGRLRSVRLQAGKARRYREFTERLQQLRTQVALVDWRTLTRQLAARDVQLKELQQRAEECKSTLNQDELADQDLDRQIAASAQQIRDLEAATATIREQIAVRQATIDNQQTRRGELEQEVAHVREQLAAIMDSGGPADVQFRDVAELLAVAEAELVAADAECRRQIECAEATHRELTDSASAQLQIRAALSQHQRELEIVGDQATSLELQLPFAISNSERSRSALAALGGQREELSRELLHLQNAEAHASADVEKHRVALAAAEQRLADVRREFARSDSQHRRMEAQLTRIRERIAVLTELEERLEGLGSGVQEVLRFAATANSQLSGHVHGVVADLFNVDVDSATLLEVALGERAQFIVLSSAKPLHEWLSAQPRRVADRVGFLMLDTQYPVNVLDRVDLATEPGVMGRADQFVETATDYQPLARRLLGRTWLVDRLTTALRLFETTGRGLEFVTSDGEFLAADGTLIVGPRHTTTGMLSRRSELRSCHEQARDLERQLAEQATIHARLEKQRAEQESQVAFLISAYTTPASKLSEAHRQTAMAAARLERVTHEHVRLEELGRLADEQIAAARAQIDANRNEQSKIQSAIGQLEIELRGSEQQLSQLQKRRDEEHNAETQQKIALARCEQRRDMLRDQMQQIHQTQHQRDLLLNDTRQQLQARETLINELETAVRDGQQVLAELHLSKKNYAETFGQYAAADERLRLDRSALADRIRAGREQLATMQSQQHKLEVAVTRIQHERQTLSDRMHDDYGIDLAAAASSAPQAPNAKEGSASIVSTPAPGPEPPAHKFDREATEREIASLRDQINNMGAINLEALNELEQLEERFTKLSGQYRDLVEAKASLERIIQRINIDSRQLFLTTLEMIRGHFQELFRRLFGGGEADIIVDEAEDVLESGIEIVARPPGKEACSISLLSGGEKTLTCVALLLAVFRSKPSPFCVLDEVDAALDEANIGRFVAVLRDFLSFTQFIVITHSKKTMAGADTLYGITMEESGVSKRVSVRFEDVSEDGHIAISALRRAA
jgi:chromosome segregation protein